MLDVTTEKYFFWGVATTTQHGLYSPVLRKIILTDGSTDAVDRLEYVAFLLSSKIELFIVPLHKAPNFEPRLVDNSCCENWDITHWPAESPQLSANYFRLQNQHRLEYCGQLTPSELVNPNIFSLKQLCWLAYEVVQFFRFGPNILYTRIYDLVTMPFVDNVSVYAEIKRRERACFDMIYHSQNYDHTEQAIEQQIDDELMQLLKDCL